MSTRLAAAMIVILGVSGDAVAGETDDPYAKDKATYYGKEVLDGALAIIAQMKEPELRAFTNYLAECVDEGNTEIANHACEAAMEKYEIEFGSYLRGHTRPLDDLIYARALLFIRLPKDRTPHPDKLPCLGLNINDAEANVACTMQTVRVITALYNAAHDRFQILKAQQK
jgi:hypothetical protein